MYAIIQTGGKQYRVQEGDILYVDRLNHDIGKTIQINSLCIEDGNNLQFENNFSVSLEIQDHLRDKKVLVVKRKKRKKYKRTHGFRAHLTALKVLSIKGTKDGS